MTPMQECCAATCSPAQEHRTQQQPTTTPGLVASVHSSSQIETMLMTIILCTHARNSCTTRNYAWATELSIAVHLKHAMRGNTHMLSSKFWRIRVESATILSLLRNSGAEMLPDPRPRCAGSILPRGNMPLTSVSGHVAGCAAHCRRGAQQRTATAQRQNTVNHQHAAAPALRASVAGLDALLADHAAPFWPHRGATCRRSPPLKRSAGAASCLL
jgi:hypothetical protein